MIAFQMSNFVCKQLGKTVIYVWATESFEIWGLEVLKIGVGVRSQKQRDVLSCAQYRFIIDN